MKKILYLSSVIILSFFVTTSCSSDFLDTNPTDKGSGEELLGDAKTALVPLNGIYRLMYTQGWSTEFNTQQTDGLSAWNLAADVMGEDMVMKAQGSGWYWNDATYTVKDRYPSDGWRPYDLWNGYYTLISNANNIIAAQHTMKGSQADIDYVIGQAYAIRAMAYNYLAMWFSRTYKGHEGDKCVPIYTQPTSIITEGRPRATVQEVYSRIKIDIDSAIVLLQNAPAQSHKSHIDYYVANGLKARICLITNDWRDAADAASIAKSKPGVQIGGAQELTNGMNNVKNRNVMWGAELITTQGQGHGTFHYHMDAFSMYDVDGAQIYAFRAPKTINQNLYNHMNPTDIRREWWDPTNSIIESDGVVLSNYIQKKFLFSDVTNGIGDRMWMRIEEMYLIEAEAECRLGQDGTAKTLLETMMLARDPSYTTSKTGMALGALTSDITNSLLEEILLQRRIELWGEYGRVFDIKRLKQGFRRTTAMGWPTAALLNARDTQDPETYAWVMTIPQAEFDGNVNMDATTDQNPLGDH